MQPCDKEPVGTIVSAPVNSTGQILGYVHSFETGAAVDGPGMRFVLFMSGCQFRCLYCHNPDTWKLHNGTPMTLDEVIAEIGRYANFLRLTGGVTISGGEPLMQAEFVGEVFRRCKTELKLHTALDTQGYLAGNVDDAWFDNVDLVLLDIKSIDPDVYLRLTGKELQPTLDFAHRLSRLQKKMWIRYVLVPGWTDKMEHVHKLAEFITPLKAGIERVEVLPFHKLGESKWQDLGLDYQLTDTLPPSIELTEAVRDVFRAKGFFTA